jgi:hypothetical protein
MALPELSCRHNSRNTEGLCDDGLSYPLDLNGWVSEVGGGFWIKVCVHAEGHEGPFPCGLSYSLTLHKANGERVVGYDNAHPFTEKRGARRVATPTADHRHYRDRIEAYAFASPAKLVEDFGLMSIGSSARRGFHDG